MIRSGGVSIPQVKENLFSLTKEASCDHCGEKTKCALKGCPVIMDYCDMVKGGDKVFCCKNCAKKDESNKLASVTARDDSRTIRKDQDRKQMRKDKEKNRWNFETEEMDEEEPIEEKETSALAILIKKYAANAYPTRKPKTSSVLNKMINKYAQHGGHDEHWDKEPTDMHEDEDMLGEDDGTFPPEYWDAQGAGYNAGHDSGDDTKNPFPPDSDLAKAWLLGMEFASKNPKSLT